jgi:hypothetical protein
MAGWKDLMYVMFVHSFVHLTVLVDTIPWPAMAGWCGHIVVHKLWLKYDTF